MSTPPVSLARRETFLPRRRSVVLKVLVDYGVLEEVVARSNDDEGLRGDFDPVGAFEGEGFGAVHRHQRKASVKRGRKRGEEFSRNEDDPLALVGFGHAEGALLVFVER